MRCYPARHLATVILLVPLWVLSAASMAQQPSSADLVAMVQSAKSQFHPLPPDQVATAKTRLRQVSRRLATFLTTAGVENAQRWKEYLQWDEMQAELDKPAGPDLAKLGQIASTYYRNYRSLEHPRFAAVRAALLDYRTAEVLAADAQLEEKYVTRLDDLASALDLYSQQPTMELNQQIGRLVGWLENAGQAKALVAAVRARYWQPNLYAAVSERVVSAGIGDEVTETTEVRDCILGTSLVGTASIQGRTEARLIDHPDKGNIELLLSGTVLSDNVGFNRGVKIFSQGVTQVMATKPIYIDARGIAADRSQAQCDTDSKINAIVAKSCLVERIAWKRAARSKSTAERIGSRHAEDQVADRMDQQAAELLNKARKEYQDKFRQPLLRRDEFPQEMKFRTAKGLLEVIWRQANATQLAAPDTPPAIAGENDVAVRLHESFVSNFSRAMIGGVRLTDQRLAEILEKNKLEVPEAVQPSDDKEPWAITFSSTDPVSATFLDNTIRFAIRGRQFELGERVVRNTLEMSAVYKLEKTPEGAHLTRQGDVSVEYIGERRQQLPPEMIIIRTVMRQKFEALFAPEFETTGIQLPGRWADGGLLHLEQMVADRGWLSLAWLQADATADAAAAATAVAAR